MNLRERLIRLTLLCLLLTMHAVSAGEAPQSPKPRYQIKQIQNPLSAEFNQQIRLTNTYGNDELFSELVEVDADTLVIMQFIFTSCSNVCPVMSTIMKAIQSDVADDARLISISIDPENDDPEELLEYARLFEAQGHWRFFTGELQDIVRLQKRLNIYQQNKMRHQPVTFILSQGHLYRLDGLPSRDDTLAELEKVVKATTPTSRLSSPST